MGWTRKSRSAYGERAVEELDQLKDDFVSTVSHELRTPLTSIRAFVQILLQQPALELEQRENSSALSTRRAND